MLYASGSAINGKSKNVWSTLLLINRTWVDAGRLRLPLCLQLSSHSPLPSRSLVVEFSSVSHLITEVTLSCYNYTPINANDKMLFTLVTLISLPLSLSLYWTHICQTIERFNETTRKLHSLKVNHFSQSNYLHYFISTFNILYQIIPFKVCCRSSLPLHHLMCAQHRHKRYRISRKDFHSLCVREWALSLCETARSG